MEKEEFSFYERKDEGEREEEDLASYQDVVVHSPPAPSFITCVDRSRLPAVKHK